MEAVIDALDKINDLEDEPFRRCKAFCFQAWKYSREEEILATLVEQILAGLVDS